MPKSKKIKWIRYFARKFCAQRFEIVMRVFYSDFFYNHFGKSIKNNMVVPERGNHAIYYDNSEWQIFVNKIFNVVCKDLVSFRRYMKIVKQRQAKYIHGAQKIATGDLKKQTWPELKKLFLRFDKLHLNFFVGPIWIPFIIEPIIAEAADRELRNLLIKNKQEDKLAEVFDVIFSPERKNAVVHEHQNLLRLALQAKQNKISKPQLNTLLEVHTRKYQWLPCYDINDKPWTKQYFNQELSNLLKLDVQQLKQEFKAIHSSFDFRKKEFNKILKDFKPTKRQKELLIMAHDMAFIKDERDDHRRQGSFNIQPLYHEMARRAHLDIKEITQLIQREMIEFLTTTKLPVSPSILKLRTKGYVLLRKHGGITHIFQGKAMEKTLRQELKPQQTTTEKSITGIVGSRGKTHGPVQVIYTKHDLRKVKQGDIMVAVTTHPDFVPAMRKCKAIITDEGGITCHAAIVSREMGTPCIVGTKIATKAFKDNDHVEVDAHKGVITKLK